MEERATFNSHLPPQIAQIQAHSELETSRRRVQADVAAFSEWVQATRPSKDLAPTRVLLDFVHARLLRLRNHPCPRRQVNRPTTVATWLRRLADAFGSKINLRGSEVSSYLTGLRAHAPAPPPVERNNQEQWAAMLRYVQARFKGTSSRKSSRLWGALLLSFHLQVQGFRPKAAMRGCLPQSRRERTSLNGEPAVRVEVILDKDNKVGAVPASRRRLVVLPPQLLERLLHCLPYPNDKPALHLLTLLRTHVKQMHEVHDLRSSRRNAAESAEEMGLPAGPVLNHRPGSRSTANYTGSLTAPTLQQSLAPLSREWQPPSGH